MTIDTQAREQTALDQAFRALYLMPAAPRPLIDAVYESLRGEPGGDRLRDAYETITRAFESELFVSPAKGDRPSRQASPWEILHLRPDAPPAAIDAAYRFRRGDAPLRPPAGSPPDSVAATFRSPRPASVVAQRELAVAERESVAVSPPPAGEGPGEGSDRASPPPAGEGSGEGSDDVVLSLIEDFAVLSVYEELLGAREDNSSPPPLGEGQGEGSDHASPPRVGACPEQSRREGPGEGSVQPALVAEDGTSVALGERPLRIGTQPSCDVVVRAAGRVEARVWRNKGRFLVHALGEGGGVLVNGRPVTWAVLNEGDALAVGPVSFRFAASKTT